MVEIPLKNGGAAIVDDDIAPRLERSTWHKGGSGYAVRYRWDKRTKRPVRVMMHRCVTRAPKGKTVHHVNGNKLDNRRDNLAVLDPVEHQRVHDQE